MLIQVRFIGELCNSHVIGSDQVIRIFRQLFTVLEEAPSNSASGDSRDDLTRKRQVQPYLVLRVSVTRAVQVQLRRDFFVAVVLASLPWVGSELQRATPTELESILSAAGAYIRERDRAGTAALHVWQRWWQGHPDLDQEEDHLDVLWTEIGLLKADNWKARFSYPWGWRGEEGYDNVLIIFTGGFFGVLLRFGFHHWFPFWLFKSSPVCCAASRHAGYGHPQTESSVHGAVLRTTCASRASAHRHSA